MEKIYLDHAATTPVHPQVAQRMAEVMTGNFGNPSSIHSFGREARRLLDESRTVLAESIHAKFTEIVLTSGGTEADNLAILGTARSNRDRGRHIITTAVEHHAVLHACQHLEKEGFDVTWLQPDKTGRIRAGDVKKALRDDTIIVSVMYGNNEVGTIQPIREIGALLKNHPAYFHTDAVQAYGAVPLDVDELNVDLLSVTAHKINGPKGTGFLYVRTGTNLAPATYGGEQELKRRAGTENLVSIAGFAEAVNVMEAEREEKRRKYDEMTAAFLSVLDGEGVEYEKNGSVEFRLPHVLNLSFPGTDVESMLMNLDMAGIAASSGSACTAGSVEPSHVLTAMYGKDSARARNSIRFSFGLGLSAGQAEEAAKRTAEIVRRLQK